jgi:hypothetical protein
MNSLIVLPSSAAVGRSASAWMDWGPPTRYYSTDTAPQGPAYTSWGFQAVHSPWEQATP